MGGTPSKELQAYDLKRSRPTLGAPPIQVKARIENIQENEKFSGEMLECHNEYRALHKVPPLKLNKKLSSLAQEWSERMTLIGMAEARPNNKFGENIYWSRWASDAKSVCASWYKEGKHYKYDKEPDPPPINNANFTQMIWKSTTDIGVGKATSWSNVTYIVCNYKVKGNIPKEFMRNLIDPGIARKKSLIEEPAPTNVKKSANQALEQFPKALVDPTFFKLMLRLTNEYRFVHGARFLKLNSTLAEHAQKEAENMATVKKLEPTTNTRLGGTYYASKWSYEAKDITQFWYHESKRFKFGREPDVVPLSTCNFTQMIWANSNEVGYGRAQASNGFVYVVAYYRPRGNIRGEFVKNVKPFNFDSTPPSGSENSPSFDRKRSVMYEPDTGVKQDWCILDTECKSFIKTVKQYKK